MQNKQSFFRLHVGLTVDNSMLIVPLPIVHREHWFLWSCPTSDSHAARQTAKPSVVLDIDYNDVLHLFVLCGICLNFSLSASYNQTFFLCSVLIVNFISGARH